MWHAYSIDKALLDDTKVVYLATLENVFQPELKLLDFVADWGILFHEPILVHYRNYVLANCMSVDLTMDA